MLNFLKNVKFWKKAPQNFFPCGGLFFRKIGRTILQIWSYKRRGVKNILYPPLDNVWGGGHINTKVVDLYKILRYGYLPYITHISHNLCRNVETNFFHNMNYKRRNVWRVRMSAFFNQIIYDSITHWIMA